METRGLAAVVPDFVSEEISVKPSSFQLAETEREIAQEALEVGHA
jgi:hypothetical protein